MNSKILVLDDDLSNADAIRLVLEDCSFNVRSISLAEELSSAVQEFEPDLIVMDILLDKGDGRELCNALKTNQRTCHIPVLLITAMLETQAKRIFNLADDIIYKPFSYNKLYTKVASLIN